MIDVSLLCRDLKQDSSLLRERSRHVITEIFAFLRNPSPRTAGLIAGWREDFQYIYGDVSSNLSSNSKLDPEKLLRDYEINGIEGETPAEALQMLFFAIQTYYSVLIKYIMAALLQEIRTENEPAQEDILLGTFAGRCGITNYCYGDWYCWPVFELDSGFGRVMEEIHSAVQAYQNEAPLSSLRLTGRHDFIKQIYESMIPKELRRALGEFYTPDWLAESALQSAVAACDAGGLASLSIVDPTCGSGTFLLKAIAMKRENGCGLETILSTVRGMDINPLAVLTAKTNYLLSVLDLLDGVTPVTIPVYNADIITLATPLEAPETEDFCASAHPSACVRGRILQDRAAARAVEKSDVITGNPPWVNWEYMPESYRLGTRQIWTDHGLFSAKGRDLSFSKEDVSVLITYIVMDLLLKDRGVLGFVIRQGVFKSARNGAGFRRFQLRDGTPVKVLKVEDLSGVRVFENAAVNAVLFFAQKGRETIYPVPYFLWSKPSGLKTRAFDACAQLPEVMEQISVEEQWAAPASASDMTSPWITAGRDRLTDMRRVLGTNPYRARTGVFTGGANAVYWLRINSAGGPYVSVTNITDRAKRKSEQITAEIEKELVYPLLRGGGVRKWHVAYDAYLLCPHTAETKIRPIPREELAVRAPKTLAYLNRFRADLDGRKGFAGWEKEIQRQEFHAILRVGAYTFSKYKVVWRYIASRFICAVIGTVNDPYLGEKLLLPNEKIMYVSTDDEGEAYYLCGMLSSTPAAQCVESYMSPTSISAHVLNKLYIPPYDAANRLHAEIAQLCKTGHGRADISACIREIDERAAEIYRAAT